MGEKRKKQSQQDGLNRKADKDLLKAVGWRLGPEKLDDILTDCWNIQEEEMPSSFAAFEAIRHICLWGWSESEKSDEPDPTFGLKPDRKVEVPWWVVYFLANYWKSFRENTDKKKTMEVIFELKGRGQGNSPPTKTLETRVRRRILATEVALEIVRAEQSGSRRSLNSIYAEIALRRDISEETIMNAWKISEQERESALRKVRDGLGKTS